MRVKPLYDLLKLDESEKLGKGRRKVDVKKGGQRHNANEPIVWDVSHQNILEEMIDLLKSPEVIAYPNFELPFFMTCDASNRGLGAVLYQTQEGVDRVISVKNYQMLNKITTCILVN